MKYFFIYLFRFIVGTFYSAIYILWYYIIVGFFSTLWNFNIKELKYRIFFDKEYKVDYTNVMVLLPKPIYYSVYAYQEHTYKTIYHYFFNCKHISSEFYSE